MQTPPHNPEAERGVIGSVLVDSASPGDDTRVLDLCFTRGVSEESFYDPRHRALFATLSELSRAGMPVDAITLDERLRATSRLEAAGGVAYIQSLIEATPTSAHAEYYIDIVRQKHLLRKLIECAAGIERKCYDTEGAAANVILGEAEKSLLAVGESAGGQLSWATAVQNTLAALERTFDRGADVFDGIPTGFKDLDAKLQGLKAGEMIVVAARPSVGKTSLAMNFAECAALGEDIGRHPFRSPDDSKKDGPVRHPTLVFSLEMNTEALARRMVCGRAGVDIYRVQRGLLNKAERAEASNRLFKASAELREAPIYIDDTGGLDVMDMRARARRMKKKHGIELIVIDYLQLCSCREFARQGRQIEVSQVSNNIKAMAKELKVPVVVLSQLSRANEQRGDKYEKPKLSDLRDSGAIEQDADVVLLLRRPCRSPKDPEHDKENLAIVDVAKHRNGETGEVRMNFIRAGTRFDNRDPAEDRENASEPPPPGYGELNPESPVF